MNPTHTLSSHRTRRRLLVGVVGLAAIVAGQAHAPTADAHEATLTARATCDGYTVTVSSSAGFTGDPTVGIYGDLNAPSSAERNLGGLSGIAPLVRPRPAGSYKGGVTLYYSDGTKSAASFSLVVPECPELAIGDPTVVSTTSTTAPAGGAPDGPSATTAVGVVPDPPSVTTPAAPITEDSFPIVAPPAPPATPPPAIVSGSIVPADPGYGTSITDGRLPRTGASSNRTLLLIAVALTVIGGLLLSARRRATVAP